MTASPLLRLLAPNTMRVTHFDPSQGLPADRPWLNDVLLPIPENEKRGSEITFELENGISFAKNSQGQTFFSEKTPPTFGIRKDRPYFYFDIPQTAFYAGRHHVDNGIRLTLKRSDGESFYGWGEWFNAFERKTGPVNLDNRNALFGEQDRLTYSGLPFFISSQGYGFLLLNSYRSQWTLMPDQLVIDADGPNADYILIYGPAFKEILRSYTALTGRPPLLPRWGFGLWVTGYPQEHQNSILENVRNHREKNIPLDAVILDYHWEERFHNFKWRQKLIPDPQALVASLSAEGIHLGLILTSYLNTHNRPIQKWLLNSFGQNVTPGLESDDERALEEFAEARSKGFLAHEKVRWWFGTGGMLDFTNPQAVAWWREKLRPLFEIGVDFIKNDDGEDLPDDAHAYNGMDGREYHNIYGFYYGRATYQRNPDTLDAAASQADKPKQTRNLIYARSAWVGSQRFPALFLGDQEANFEGIRRSIRAGLNLALSGFSYWTADVFGLSGKTTPEVHMRYAQWALLSPVARYFVRPAQIDNTRFPWSHNPEVEANFKKHAELRLRLLPYYNSLAHESYNTGLPIMRPPMLEFQDDIRFRRVDDQIMLGSSLMICPVIEAGATSRKITLPAGQWHDFWSDDSWQGPDIIEYPAPLDRLPLLVRGGTILPMGPAAQNIPNRHIFDPLELNIWSPYPAKGLFYDDDGYSTGYQQGEFSRMDLQAEVHGTNLTIHISKTQGQFEGQPEKRWVNIILHGDQQGIVDYACANGQDIPVSFSSGSFSIAFEQVIANDTLVEIIFRS